MFSNRGLFGFLMHAYPTTNHYYSNKKCFIYQGVILTEPSCQDNGTKNNKGIYLDVLLTVRPLWAIISCGKKKQRRHGSNQSSQSHNYVYIL